MNQKKKGVDLNKDPKKLLAIAVANRRKIATQAVAAKKVETTVKTSSPTVSTTKPVAQNRLTRTVSIKQRLSATATENTTTTQPKKAVVSTTEIETVEDLELNIENLKQQFAVFVQQKNKGERLKVALSVCEPQLAQSHIVLNAGNNLQVDDLEASRLELQNYLQRAFSDSNLIIHIKLPEKSITKKVFTETDRFNYLCKKNPVLASLKQKFYLDFD